MILGEPWTWWAFMVALLVLMLVIRAVAKSRERP